MNPKLSHSGWLRPFILAVALLLSTHTFAADVTALFGPWMHQDIGAVEMPGGAAFENNVFTVKGTLDIWGKADGFHYVYQPFIGDGEIVARVTAVQNTMNHAKAGLMIREELTPGAKHATIAVTATDGAQFLKRVTADDVTTVAKLGGNKNTFPYWVKLVRQGDTFTAYESLDGQKWETTGTDTVKMGRRVYVGLVASSHKSDVLNTSTLDHVTVTNAGAASK